MDRFNRISTIIIFFIYCAFLPVWIYNLTWVNALLAVGMYWFLADVVQGLFLHRWASHELWSPPSWLQKALSTISVFALSGNPIGYAALHRQHHKYTDTENDPHSPKHKGVWYVTSSLWRFEKIDPKRVADRLRVPYFISIGKWEGIIAITFNLLLFAIVYNTLGLQWFLTVWATPVALSIILINFFVNVALHKKGKPVDNKLFWPFAFSECLHGTHHYGPMKLNYNMWDPSGRLVSLFGWTKESLSYKDATSVPKYHRTP